MTNEQAIAILREMQPTIAHCDKDARRQIAIRMAIESLQERKTGKWFDTADEYDKRAQKHDYFCLECKTHAMDFICGSEDWWCNQPPKYCPFCGTKMEVDE